MFCLLHWLCLPHEFQSKNAWRSWPRPLRMTNGIQKKETKRKITLGKSVGLSVTVQCGRGYVDINKSPRLWSNDLDTKFYPSSLNKHMCTISKDAWQRAFINTFLCSFIHTFNRYYRVPIKYVSPHGRYGHPVVTCVNMAPVATRQPRAKAPSLCGARKIKPMHE